MTEPRSAAFKPLDARAAETGDGPAPDRISLRDHVVAVDIGAFQPERGHTQRVRFNVVVETATRAEVLSDDVDLVLSYDTIITAIEESLLEERLNLLETLAERVAARILADPRAARAFVRIEKLDRGPYALGVEIVRSRADIDAAANAADVPHPRVVLISNSAFDPAVLRPILDRLQADETPTILCVGRGDGVRPNSKATAAQRRIDLLAVEQNAWVLAGLDRRCMVVASRTELDWCMREGRIAVWAPSKMILDAVDHPLDRVDAPTLCEWIGAHLEASDLVWVDPPEGADVPASLRAVPAEADAVLSGA